MERSRYFARQPLSLKAQLLRPELSGIIAEYKRRSPSLGVINAQATVEQTTAGYVRAGASALSVLTDTEFFGGSYQDLTTARELNACPILRKDFMIDEYQILEARAMGADVILLIAGILEADEVKRLGAFARSLGLESLLEVHDRQELERTLCQEVDLIGVNNRNLKDFSVSVDTSRELAALIPDQFIKVSESGISKPETVQDLMRYGYRGFLMGEAFMKTSQPEQVCAAFIRQLKQLTAV